jgi:hypothetical protein
VTLFLASLLLGVAAAGWVVFPILRGRAALLADTVPGDVLDAEARRRVALGALREAEHDHVAGKLDDRDYGVLRARLEREAVAAIDRTAVDTSMAAIAGVPHACGFTNPPDSRYCAGCGQPL